MIAVAICLQVELLVPVVAVVTVLHVALVAMGKLQAEAGGICEVIEAVPRIPW